MRYCPRCQASVPEKSRFCIQCGLQFDNRVERLSTAALICGILSTAMLWNGAGLLIGIPGIILAFIAKKCALSSQSTKRVKMALSFSVIGIVGSVVVVLLFLGLGALILKAMQEGMPR